MGKSYDQLTLEERCTIARLHQAGQSIRQIATALDRSPSSVSRELKRNHGRQVGYKPGYAQEQAAARRWKGLRLERNAKLREIVLGCLQRGWSPEQIAGWLKHHKQPITVSHETIYRFIYAQIRRTNDGAWRHYLPCAKYKRGWRAKAGGSPASFIKGRVSMPCAIRCARDDSFTRIKQKGRGLLPGPSVISVVDRTRSPCRRHPCRHPAASAGPSSPASRRPSPRWSPAGRPPKRRPAGRCARPWSGR